VVVTGVEAGNFLGIQGYFCLNFHKFVQKILWDKLLPTNFLQLFVHYVFLTMLPWT